MNRLLWLQWKLLERIDAYEKKVPERDYKANWERLHISGCAKIGYMLAEERGVDPVLAACACACHDYGRIISGKQAGHAEYGYQPVKEFLRETELFNEEEIEEIALAVKNHSKKGEIGTPLEEIVKDADILDFYQYDCPFSREEQRERYLRLVKS